MIEKIIHYEQIHVNQQAYSFFIEQAVDKTKSLVIIENIMSDNHRIRQQKIFVSEKNIGKFAEVLLKMLPQFQMDQEHL